MADDPQMTGPQGAGDGEGIESQLGLGGGAEREMEVESPRRAASLTLATDETREARAVSMEAAHRSLAEALGITYRLLQVLIVALVGLFLFSGLQPVSETELAVKTRFGQVVEEDISAGFAFSLPYPIGDVRTAPAAERTITISRPFFPRLTENEQNDPISEQTGRSSIDPKRDGTVITADGDLAIVRLQVSYRISDASSFLRNVGPAPARESGPPLSESEQLQNAAELFVRAMVQAATVNVTAETPIDALVGENVANLQGDADVDAEAIAAVAGASAIGEREVQNAIRAAAQERLDRMGAGIDITSVILRDAFPPRWVLSRFREAIRDVAEARSTVEQARTEATSELVGAVGRDHERVAALLDLYESRREAGDDAADELLEAIYGVLNNAYASEPLVVDGEEIGTIRVSGEVAQLLSEAQSYRDSVADLAQAEVNTFTAALAQYSENPAAFVARRWSLAMRTIFESDDRLVTVFTLPPDAESFRLLLNDDPEIRRRIERELNRIARDRAIERREEEAGLR